MTASSRASALTPERLGELNSGSVPSKTLAEALAIDHVTLMASVLPDAPGALIEAVALAQQKGMLSRMQAIGAALRLHLNDHTMSVLTEHPSDTVRGWACFSIAADPELQGVGPLLEALRRAADDPHFGVREWVWMAARPIMVTQLDESIGLLAGWTRSESERIRRFASEALRPRGVWAKHIAGLKRQPERALPILEPLRADPSRYVQDSVANWINDASKTRPDWACSLGERWLDESPSQATQRIIARGLRSVSR